MFDPSEGINHVYVKMLLGETVIDAGYTTSGAITLYAPTEGKYVVQIEYINQAATVSVKRGGGETTFSILAPRFPARLP